jgi:LPXTG-site transpeptidase (sortase) family protein
MTQARVRQASRGRRAGHTLAGFTLGVVAVAIGLLFARPAADEPLNEAARYAEQVAAVQLMADPDRRPSDEPVAVAEPVVFAGDGEMGSLFSNRHATRVVIASIGLDADVSPVGLVFRAGELQYDVPRLEAGQYVGTAAPGEAGNVVIGGHVARRGASGIFQALPKVVAGDVVEVYRGDRVYRYSVIEIKVVAADATDVMGSTQDATLTLITCFPEDNYAERLVVIGRLL